MTTATGQRSEAVAKSMVSKTILNQGTLNERVKFLDGSKAVFHFKTHRYQSPVCADQADGHECDGDHVHEHDDALVDDTRTMRRPMEFIFGKQFKLEVWEQCIRTMQIGEIARFVVDKSLVSSYPMVSKMIRAAFGDAKEAAVAAAASTTGHCCGGMMAIGGGGSQASDGPRTAPMPSLGYADLDELAKNPCDLVFTFELLQVMAPGEYEKDSWAMDSDEKLASIPQLREEGNRLYHDQKPTEAGLKYAEALGRLEQLLLREKPGDEEWTALDAMKVPLLLNYSQCKLLESDYYSVIEHTSEVLKRDSNNVKALFRRARAHVGAWNPDEARQDYEHILGLDPTMTAAVERELAKLDDAIRQKNQEDRSRLAGKLF